MSEQLSSQMPRRSTQPGDAADAVPDVVFGADPDAVVAVDEGDVFHRVVAALEVERPGIGVDGVGLLLGIEDGQTLDRCRIAQLEQGGAILLVPAAGGQDDGADQRLDVDRGLVGADQGHARGNLQAAGDQILAGREPDHAALLGRRIQGLLDGGRVVGLAVRLGPERCDVEIVLRGIFHGIRRSHHRNGDGQGQRRDNNPTHSFRQTLANHVECLL